MIKNNHHQSKEIESIVNELLTMRNQLKDTSAIRKLRLDDSLESQQFFIQCHELVNNWLKYCSYINKQKGLLGVTGQLR